MIPASHLFDQSTMAALLEHDPVVQDYRAFFALQSSAARFRTPSRRRGGPFSRAHPGSRRCALSYRQSVCAR
jgi:hypothetical protein